MFSPTSPGLFHTRVPFLGTQYVNRRKARENTAEKGPECATSPDLDHGEAECVCLTAAGGAQSRSSRPGSRVRLVSDSPWPGAPGGSSVPASRADGRHPCSCSEQERKGGREAEHHPEAGLGATEAVSVVAGGREPATAPAGAQMGPAARLPGNASLQQDSDSTHGSAICPVSSCASPQQAFFPCWAGLPGAGSG